MFNDREVSVYDDGFLSKIETAIAEPRLKTIAPPTTPGQVDRNTPSPKIPTAELLIVWAIIAKKTLPDILRNARIPKECGPFLTEQSCGDSLERLRWKA